MGLESHVRDFVKQQFNADCWVDAGSPGSTIVVHLKNNAVRCQDLRNIASALADEVFTPDALFYVRDDDSGRFTSPPIRGRTPLFRQEQAMDTKHITNQILQGAKPADALAGKRISEDPYVDQAWQIVGDGDKIGVTDIYLGSGPTLALQTNRPDSSDLETLYGDLAARLLRQIPGLYAVLLVAKNDQDVEIKR